MKKEEKMIKEKSLIDKEKNAIKKAEDAITSANEEGSETSAAKSADLDKKIAAANAKKTVTEN